MNKMLIVSHTMIGGIVMEKYHSGESCPKSGKYSEYTKDGKLYNEDIDIEKGQRFPPTQEKGSYFELQK